MSDEKLVNGDWELHLQGDGNLIVRRISDGRIVWSLDREKDATWPLPPPERPTPPPTHGDLTTWPRYGISYQNLLGNPNCDPMAFLGRIADMGATLTRIWLLDAWAQGERINDGLGAAFKPGQYSGYWPFRRRLDGQFNLFEWNLDYFARLRRTVEVANRLGILPILTLLELYTWSDRKAGLLWVPTVETGPFRFNVNDIQWGHPDDHTFETLPDTWVNEFVWNVTQTLDGLAYSLEIGNEMPEKALHYRMKSLIAACGFTGTVIVNRQEDTPGQYDNMRIGQDFSLLSLHGKRDLDYLDEVFDREPVYRTFREFYEAGRFEPSRIMLSSDGCRASTDPTAAYDYEALLGVALDAKARGFSYEHQSCIKLRPFTEGRLDLDDLQYDAPFFARLING